MTLKDYRKLAEATKGVEPDKFDRHMKRARVEDIRSRERIFMRQSDEQSRKRDERDGLKGSVY